MKQHPIGNVIELKALLNEKKVNINIQNSDGETPLMRAAFFGNVKVVELLLKYGADKTITRTNGMNAFDIAIFCNIETQYKSGWHVTKLLLPNGLTDDQIAEIRDQRRMQLGFKYPWQM